MRNNNKPSVLIVDDEQVIRDLFERFLRKEGYRTSSPLILGISRNTLRSRMKEYGLK